MNMCVPPVHFSHPATFRRPTYTVTPAKAGVSRGQRALSSGCTFPHPAGIDTAHFSGVFQSLADVQQKASNQSMIINLNGWPGVGKLTIGLELAELIGAR